jgi:putative transposase
MDHETADQNAWATARQREHVLSQLPARPSQAAIRDAMEELGTSRATLFRWLRRFRESGRTSSLLPRPTGPGLGVQPFDPPVLAIVERHFEQLYATRRKPTLTRLWREIAADCRAVGLAAPSIRRLQRWVAGKSQADLLRRREGEGKSEPAYLATPGHFEAKRPLDVMQIDHTSVDVTVVDADTRLALGRPTLTLAIDVNTRMVMGFHLSLEPPSLLATALCLTHAAMDKTTWLAARDIAAAWPARGVPRIIHVDNGAEFHAAAFERACEEHAIGLTYRPPGTPRFGGHIERLIGTMMGAVHLVPGSHFSNVRERGDLGPEKTASLTLGELETYLALEIVGAYHARVHKALGLPPNAAWNERIAEVAARTPKDPRLFLIDFLPAKTRILQRDGVHLFQIRYWSEDFRWLFGRGDTEVTLKYDPRDLSRIFVRAGLDYCEARPADLTRPAVALWEHRAALRSLRAAGRRAVDENLIFATILAQRALVDEAVRATKATRRAQSRRPRQTEQSIEAPPPPAPDPPRALPYFPVEEWDD